MIKKIKDISYFFLKLQDYINDCHPDIMDDIQFITERSNLAEDAYNGAFQIGCSSFEALNIANKVLYEGLYFSKFSMLYDIISEEFYNEIPETEAKDFAIKFLKSCDSIFEEYNHEIQYDLLRTELIGAIVIYLEDYVLQ